jgi:hypothetical protein
MECVLCLTMYMFVVSFFVASSLVKIPGMPSLDRSQHVGHFFPGLQLVAHVIGQPLSTGAMILFMAFRNWLSDDSRYGLASMNKHMQVIKSHSPLLLYLSPVGCLLPDYFHVCCRVTGFNDGSRCRACKASKQNEYGSTLRGPFAVVSRFFCACTPRAMS